SSSSSFHWLTTMSTNSLATTGPSSRNPSTLAFSSLFLISLRTRITPNASLLANSTTSLRITTSTFFSPSFLSSFSLSPVPFPASWHASTRSDATYAAPNSTPFLMHAAPCTPLHSPPTSSCVPVPSPAHPPPCEPRPAAMPPS